MPRININITAGINFAIEHKDSYISYIEESIYYVNKMKLLQVE